jgi:hypothetical protein
MVEVERQGSIAPRFGLAARGVVVDDDVILRRHAGRVEH